MRYYNYTSFCIICQVIFCADLRICGRPRGSVSLRLGHARGLIAHRAIIQHPRAASLPRLSFSRANVVRHYNIPINSACSSKRRNQYNRPKNSKNYIHNSNGYQILFFVIRPSIISHIHFSVSLHSLHYAMCALPFEFHTQEEINSANRQANRGYYPTDFAKQNKYRRNNLKCFPEIRPKYNFSLLLTAHICSRSAAQPS